MWKLFREEILKLLYLTQFKDAFDVSSPYVYVLVYDPSPEAVCKRRLLYKVRVNQSVLFFILNPHPL